MGSSDLLVERRTFAGERGSTCVEYVLLLAGVILAANVGVATVGINASLAFSLPAEAIGGSVEGIEPPGN